ncbi:unnamed protein product, partial [Effrenium voratum]
ARDVHVALSGDGRHLEGLLAVLQSVLLGTAAPGRICVHVFVLQIELNGVLAAFRCSFQGRLLQDESADGQDIFIDGVAVRVHVFSESEVLTADLAVDAGVTVEDYLFGHGCYRQR